MSKIDWINVGDQVSTTRKATTEIIERLAEISGDVNPIHLSEEYAKKTVFGARIAHALFCLGIVSDLIGTKLPGNGAVFVAENIKYRAPVYLGDDITVIVDVRELYQEKDKLIMGIRCVNQDDVVVIDGDALVKVI